MSMTTTDLPKRRAVIRNVSEKEWMAGLDRQAQRYLGISGEEFIRRWKNGYWPDPDSVPSVMRLVMLLPPNIASNR